MARLNTIIIIMVATAILLSNPVMAQAKGTSKCAVSGCHMDVEGSSKYCKKHKESASSGNSTKKSSSYKKSSSKSYKSSKKTYDPYDVHN